MDDPGDDDETPREATPSRLRARRVQSAEDRDLDSGRWRRHRARAAAREALEGIDPDEETTDPMALLPREPDESVVAAVRRAGRDTEQPVRFAELAQLLGIVKEQLRKDLRRSHEDSERRQAEELRSLLERPPAGQHYKLVDVVEATRSEVKTARNDLMAQGTEIEKQGKAIGLARKLIAAALVAGLGALGTVAKGLYERGGRETAIDLRLERCEKDIEHLERLGERDRDRREREPTIFPPLPTVKGPNP